MVLVWFLPFWEGMDSNSNTKVQFSYFVVTRYHGISFVFFETEDGITIPIPRLQLFPILWFHMIMVFVLFLFEAEDG